jgi:hypothetical protein
MAVAVTRSDRRGLLLGLLLLQLLHCVRLESCMLIGCLVCRLLAGAGAGRGLMQGQQDREQQQRQHTKSGNMRCLCI